MAVAGYNIYVDGVKQNTSLVTNLTYALSGLTASTSYGVTVSAVDDAGNESAQSAPVNFTTSAAAGGGGVIEEGSWEQGGMSPEGINVVSAIRIRTVNTTPVTTPITVTSNIVSPYRFAVRYGTGGNYTGGDSGWLTQGMQFTIPSGTDFRLTMSKTDDSNIVPSEADGFELTTV